jgi:hypothetical protein
MSHISSTLLGGFAAVVAWMMVAPADSGTETASQSGTRMQVERAMKGDRLVPATNQPATAERRTVTAIEVVGLDDTTIVYRDRDGNVLFRTDPVRNVTVVAKGIKLPEVTVRRDAQTTPTPMPLRLPDDKQGKLPVGCEPPASPIVSPQLSRLPGRCLAMTDEPTHQQPVRLADARG